MDEIFGYFPPTANPPSKKPMLLLLKQARAFGLGVVLSTQNPVDLDYKGLANIGTWFVGRLQTSQDQERVLEGIVGASGGTLDRQQVRSMLAAMKGRQFMLTSAHLDVPLLFETRWVLCYLRGPLSAADIKRLSAGPGDAVSAGADPAVAASAAPPATVAAGVIDHPPIVAQGIEQLYLLHDIPSEKPAFEPWLAATAAVRYASSAKNIEVVEEVNCRIYLDDAFARPDWANAEEIPRPLGDCASQAPTGSCWYPLPGTLSQLRDLSSLAKGFSDFLYQNRRLELFRVAALKLESRPGESPGDFNVRLADTLRQRRDAELDKLRQASAVQQKRLEDRLAAAMERVDKEKSDVAAKTTDTVISFGAAVLGAFLGRRAVSASTVSKAATGMRNVGRVAKEKGDVQRAEVEVQELQQQLNVLAADIEAKATAMAATFSPDQYTIETFAIKPRRSDVYNVRLALLWEMVPDRGLPAA